MAQRSRDALVAQLGDEVRATQSAVDALDDAVATYLQVNRTDLRCLEILLLESDSATPGQLATRLGLTTGSVTAMLDRLARLGYVTRTPDAADRRKVVVRATPTVGEKVFAIYGPIAEAGARELHRYTIEQLELLIDFHQRGRALQEAHLTRIRALPRD
jgi:DNA-binding MarR family transcriptional regulator